MGISMEIVYDNNTNASTTFITQTKHRFAINQVMKLLV